MEPLSWQQKGWLCKTCRIKVAISDYANILGLRQNFLDVGLLQIHWYLW
jgi:hypothetical protein